MKKVLLWLLLLLSSLSLEAQSIRLQMEQARSNYAFQLTLAVQDSLSGQGVAFASVYLTPFKDTLITHFTLSDASGKAVLDQVTRGAYVLHAEMLGYKPYSKRFFFSEGKDLGVIRMQEDAQVLDAAKVTATVKAMEMRGDTLVYNAAAFSIAENDMLKDLLRKMPGIEVGRTAA